MTQAPTKSALQAKLEARAPHQKLVPLGKAFPGIDGEAVTIRLLRKGAQNDALEAALSRIDKLAEKSPALKHDDGFVRELKTIARLFAACRDAKDPNGLPAFPSPEFMERNLSTQEFDFLLNAYNAFDREIHPEGADHLDPEKLVGLLDTCAEHASSDLPNQILLGFSREILAEMVVRGALLRRDALEDARAANEVLDRMKSAGFVPPDERAENETDDISPIGARLLAEDPNDDLLATMATKIRTRRDAALLMAYKGWKEGPAWRRVMGEERGETST